MTDGTREFHASMSPGEPLKVQMLSPGEAAFSVDIPLVITGSSNAADGKQALFVDTPFLPGGFTMPPDSVDFATIVGAARIVGGKGQKIVYATAQYIVVGRAGMQLTHIASGVAD
ncbi:hypothetical protein [Acidovorax sp. CCYZU-2555]|uniref:hypothetical protein n=1 Tax=Acidovorax sp. CCYZU-2555 TaxID=2835042 RepID=UPI001BCE93A7|nr:hypothetical protein [Acidovorax sp. CCYZU-2555]MBS7780757.1 hypothetical protein [Acidovorax sp. CCYZU-2555]